MSSVAEEKTSRIAEMLVASVNPSALLSGKIAASATLAVIQMIIWIAIGFLLGAHPGAPAALEAADSSRATTFSLSSVSSADLAGFAAFFLLGYLQVSTMFAAVGSLVNRTEDLGALAGPLVIPIVAAFLIAMTALAAPDTPVVIITSFVPLIAPFVMFARIVVSDVPAWQVMLSLAINIAATWGIAVLAGKIYRVGMLLYGRPPKLAQIWSVIRS
jgi:ABC-2 type transport system permease protein